MDIDYLNTEQRERLRRQFIAGSGDACWDWGGQVDRYGYGAFPVKRQQRKRHFGAHRLVYELYVGPIPAGLVIDHLCRNRLCVNPAHMEPVTNAENLRRGKGRANEKATHCKRGHEFTPENTRLCMKHGYECRECRTCKAEYAARYYAAHKSA